MVIIKEIKNDKYWIRQQDNLEFMKELENDSIDLIYSDILYGTGKNFGDYQDLKSDRKVIEEHYVPRIQEMHRVLKDTGSIYLQCDYRINHWIRCILDDVFGYEMFKNEIVWDYGGQSLKTDISNKHDLILRYTKSNNYIYNTQYKPHTERSKKEYRHLVDGKMCARTKRGDKFYYSPLNEEGTNITSVWSDIGLLTPSSKERKTIGYATQKPKALLERIIKASSNEGDVVADFFMGSGTTGEVSLDLDRKFIGCDIGEKAFIITENRLKNHLT